MEPITLTTERLRLRPYAPEDVDRVFEACQDPDIQRWTVVPSPYSRQDAEFFVLRLAPEGWSSGREYAFAVEPVQGGPLFAAIGVSARAEGVYEVGFWQAKERRGQGFMAEAVGAVAHWAFTGLGCHRLVWRAEVGNAPSRAVAERAGFTVEGVERAGLVNKGTVRDSWSASLLPSDLGLPAPLPYLPARV
ncbi:GNAT family protein [Streptomyces sp. NPDC048659]|uniref:GNAT family N-acetyltransferase n=1 Tax=Streptomyces sp. NPDC048659 TaxID=3155489 RepID=UPI00343F54DB